MPSLTNGARALLFPNGLSPLLSVFVNNAQTRKSALTGIADVVGGYLDEIVRERVAAKFVDLLTAKEEEEAQAESRANLRKRQAVVWSLDQPR